MKTIFLLVLSSCALVSYGQTQSYTLPANWDKNFIITTVYMGDPSGSKSQLRITYDSCTYISTSLDPKLKNKTFLLSQTDRDLILAKLRELKIDSIKSLTPAPALRKGGEIDMCLGKTCINWGSNSGLNEKDKKIFLATNRYLNDFAMKR